MKLLKLFPLLALMMLVSCNTGKKEKAEEKEEGMAEMRTSDESMKDWVAAWNHNDAQSVQAGMADDAVLLMDGMAKTDDSVASWIKNGTAMMKDLKTKTVMKNSGDNIAYEAGTFSHSSKENDSLKFEGTYTVVWERMKGENNKSDWKIKVMSVSDKTGQDSLHMNADNMKKKDDMK